MKMNTNTSLSCRWLFSLLALAAAGLLWIGPARAEEKGEPSKGPAPAETQPAPPSPDVTNVVVVFKLKNATAKPLARAVQGVFGRECRVTEDESSNSLVVSAPRQILDKVAKLVEQLDAETTSPAQRSASEIRVYNLKYARANDIAEILARVVGGGVNSAVQQAANALVVSAPPERLKLVEGLLKDLDREPAQPPSSGLQTRIFQLKYGPDEAMQKALESLLIDRSRMPQPNRFAIDAPRHCVIITGTEEALSAAAQIIKSLDQPPPAPAMIEVTGARVRIVWLVAQGADMGASAPPPSDLREVIEELAQIGVSDLSLAAQTVVQTMPNEEFTARCSFQLADPIDLEIAGNLKESPSGAPALKLELSGRETITRKGETAGQGPPQPTRIEQRKICDLSTTVLAPPGHATVLGVTPVGTATSVFVVQVMPEKLSVARPPAPPTPPPGVPVVPRPPAPPGRSR